MNFRAFFCATVAALGALGAVQAQPVATPAEPASPHTLRANAAAVSDYRFRGVSQRYGWPAIQRGSAFTHAGGFYLGNWNSILPSNPYNSVGVEVDIYTGYRFALNKDLSAEVGLLHYLYPGAKLHSAPKTPISNKYDTTKIYFALTQGALNAKLAYAATDYSGLNSTTSGHGYFNALPARANSKGTTYLNLNDIFDQGNNIALGLHAGRTSVRRYSELSYADYKASFGKEFAGVDLKPCGGWQQRRQHSLVGCRLCRDAPQEARKNGMVDGMVGFFQQSVLKRMVAKTAVPARAGVRLSHALFDSQVVF